MPTIRQLSASVINKIAAGEVIERPASVVKELMENSLDAGATRIDINVGQGGLELIRVADNGCGIDADELPLAVAPHATSKIASADDLFRVGTLGFRGEALASIAEISRLVLRTRTAESTAGAQLEVVGGHSQGVSPCGCPLGTTIEVHNLFYNTPVRRKFMRTTQTEMGHLGEAFTRLALAHPHVHCTLRHNEREIYDLPPTDDWRTRVAAFFGEDLAGDLIAVSSDDGGVRLTGFVANPTHSRANAKMQYLFLNGRAIRDRSLQHALSEAYRGLLLTGRYPIAFLQIEMPLDLVDVNVHPTKMEVRFQESGRLYSQLLGTLRTRFLTTDLTARLSPTAESDPGAAHDAQHAEQLRAELVGWAKGQLASAGAPLAAGHAAGMQVAQPAAQSRLEWNFSQPRAPLDLVKLDRNWPAVGADDEDEDDDELSAAESELERRDGFNFGSSATTMSGPHYPTDPARPVAALQLHNRYLIAETDDGMLVIDQHALHERILYEHLREKVLAGALESQRLLVPEPVDLTPAEAASALENRELFARLGIVLEAFGGDTVLVSSYPAMLSNFSPGQVLRDLVDHLLSRGKAPERRDLIDELLHMISCKAAIKAGDRLSGEEIAALLEQRHLAQDTHHCPHGRPTALVFTREELDKQFKRT